MTYSVCACLDIINRLASNDLFCMSWVFNDSPRHIEYDMSSAYFTITDTSFILRRIDIIDRIESNKNDAVRMSWAANDSPFNALSYSVCIHKKDT